MSDPSIEARLCAGIAAEMAAYDAAAELYERWAIQQPKVSE